MSGRPAIAATTGLNKRRALSAFAFPTCLNIHRLMAIFKDQGGDGIKARDHIPFKVAESTLVTAVTNESCFCFQF